MKRCLIAIALAVPVLAHAGADDADVSESQPDGDAWIDAKTITATASSTLCEKKPKLCHEAAQALDGKNDTAWCVRGGDGVGASLTLTFASPQTVATIGVLPLFAKSFAIAEGNNRVETIEIATGAGTFTADFDDFVPIVKKQNGVHEVRDPCGCGDETCMSRDERITTGERYAYLPKPVKTSKLTLTIKSVFKGAKYHDTCITQVDVYRAAK
jgi:hypothetical protein